MLERYAPKTNQEKDNAMKKIIKEIILCGLSRGNFFDKAAFYGRTALRIFYGLDRYSEDLDFSLVEPDANFSLEEFSLL